jgi:hypothetical protein
MKIPVTQGFDKQHVIGALELSDDAIVTLDMVIAFGFRAMSSTEDGKPTDLRLQEASLVPDTRMYPATKQQPATDASTDLTQKVIFYLKGYAAGKNILREAVSMDDATGKIAIYITNKLPYSSRDTLANSMLEAALRHVDWESVARTMIMYYGLTMPWTEDM